MPESLVVGVGDKQFTFAVCRTGQELTKGLGGVASLSDLGVDGMLFDFEVSFRAIMTPRGLQFPVEVAFINPAGFVMEILTLSPRYGHNITASTFVRYALEVPVGFFAANGIQVGTKFSL